MPSQVVQWYTQFITSELFNNLWVPAIVVAAVYMLFRLFKVVTDR